MNFKNEELYHNEWVSLYKIAVPERLIRGHVYSHETRCNGRIVAILPYKQENLVKEFLVRSEVTPCWNPTEPQISTITGGVEDDYAKLTATKEIEEEAGYIVSMSELVELGTSRASKSSDTLYDLFTVDLTGKKQTEPTGEDARKGTGNTVKWVTEEELINCQDPQIFVILWRLNHDGKSKT